MDASSIFSLVARKTRYRYGNGHKLSTGAIIGIVVGIVVVIIIALVTAFFVYRLLRQRQRAANVGVKVEEGKPVERPPGNVGSYLPLPPQQGPPQQQYPMADTSGSGIQQTTGNTGANADYYQHQ